MNKPLALACLLLSMATQSLGQATAAYVDARKPFLQAQELYQKAQYSLAYPIFKQLYQEQSVLNPHYGPLPADDVRYYTLTCALKLNEPWAEDAAEAFCELANNKPRVGQLYYHLGDYRFRNGDFSKAMQAFEKAEMANLSNQEMANYQFQLGYCYFQSQQYDKAKPLFQSVRQLPADPHFLDANYYAGFIAFYQKQYPEAQQCFTIVQDHPEYGQVVPYYMAQIYYFQGNKERAYEYAEQRLNKAVTQVYDKEMRQLIGHAYFEKQAFEKAIPYQEAYIKSATKVKREDMYELSYSYYRLGALNKAIAGFKQLSGGEDSLSQHAMYLLGDCYLRTNQKANARSAFQFCAANSSNPTQKEVAQFQYGKLSYELGYQDVAQQSLSQFLGAYPTSSYRNEARELLIQLLAKTNNYREALSLLESVENPSTAILQVLPRVQLGRATEFINDGLLRDADGLLEKVLANKTATWQIVSLAKFWKAEIAFKHENFAAAIPLWKEYLQQPVLAGEASVNAARYNMGYAYLGLSDYANAQVAFGQVVKPESAAPVALVQDATVRLADTYFMQRNYKQANLLYQQALSENTSLADYALFQKGIIAGVQSPSQKLQLLGSLEKQFPSSGLIAPAQLEMANTYLVDEQYEQAIPYLEKILSSKEESLKPIAHLKAGVAYFNANNNAAALQQFQTLIAKYPNAAEVDDALENAKAIYVEEGKAQEYIAFVKKAGRNISISQEDSLSYATAQTQLLAGNKAAALVAYTDYITRYPNGEKWIAAQFQRGSLLQENKDFSNAAAAFEAVGAKHPNLYAERAALQAARIYYFDLQQLDKAVSQYALVQQIAVQPTNKLEALRGLLRCQYQLNQLAAAENTAKELLAIKSAGTDDRILAFLIVAKQLQAAQQWDAAIQNYKQVTTLSKAAYGAEARYQIAAILFQQQQYKAAEKAAFEVINKSGSYAEWVTKSYLILGDIYLVDKDYFNAKATYQSVYENSTLPALKEEAGKKLAQTVEAEKLNSKIEQE